MGIVSSKTPGGMPGICPVCGASIVVTPSEPLDDAPCPNCGVLLWPIQGQQSAFLIHAGRISHEDREWLHETARRLDQGDPDSLDQVELIMDLEERFELSIPDEVASTWHSIDDFLDWWHRRGSGYE